VLWIDGLDEAFGPTGRYHDTPGLPGLLPARLPATVYAVLTSRPGDHLHWLRDPTLCVRHRLEDKRDTNVADVRRYFTDHRKDVDPPLEEEFIARAAERTQGKFYVAVHKLAEVQRDPAAPRDPQTIPPSVHDYHAEVYQRVVARARQEKIRGEQVRFVLGLLAEAKEPLALEHLEAFDVPDHAEQILAWAAEYFRHRPLQRDPRLPFEFNHTSVPEFLAAGLTPGERRRIHAHLAKATQRWPDLTEEPRRYALRNLPAHLIAAGAAAAELDQLCNVLTDFTFLQAKIGADGHEGMEAPATIADVLDDFRRALAANPPDRPRRDEIMALNQVLGENSGELKADPALLIQQVANARDWERTALGAKVSEAVRRFQKPWLRCLKQVEGERIQRPLGMRTGHPDHVCSVAFTPDGHTLASGHRDGTVVFWDVRTGEPLRTLEGHTGRVLSVAFAPDGYTLASGGDDGTVRLWDVRTGQPLHTLEGHKDWVRSVAFTPDGRTLASGSDDCMMRLWDVRIGQLLRTLEGHTDFVTAVDFAPDGRTLASGARDGTMHLWDEGNGRPIRTLEGHNSWVWSLAFSPDGRTLASGDDVGRVLLWNYRTGQPLHTLRGNTGWVWSVAFSPDGCTLASGGYDPTVEVWDAQTGRLLSWMPCADAVRALWFDPALPQLSVAESGGAANWPRPYILEIVRP
jgi:hypothetical protein